MIQQYNLRHQTKGEQSGCKPSKLRCFVGMPWGHLVWEVQPSTMLLHKLDMSSSPRPLWPLVIESPAISFRYNMLQHAWTMSIEPNLPIVRICELICKSLSVEAPCHVFVGWAGSHTNLQHQMRHGQSWHPFYALEEREGKIPKMLWTFSDIINLNFVLRISPDSSLAPWLSE